MFGETERRYLETARVARLATADDDGRPHVVPICFALEGEGLVSPIDEKPKAADPTALRRVRDVRANPRVAVVADHYVEHWDDLGWVQVRGTASIRGPSEAGHGTAVEALREKYDQYVAHALEERPLISIEPRSVRSWGRLDRPDGA